MRYLLLIITMMFIFNSNAEEKKEWVDEAKLQAEALSKKCHDKTISPVLDSAFYNDEIKMAYKKKYNPCLKEIIIAKIKEKSTPEDAEKMIKALNQIEQGIIEFYGVLYSQEDTGFYGRAVNDLELGRRYEDIIYDVLRYQSIYATDEKTD